MKKQTTYLLLTLILLGVKDFAQLDTLYSVFEFESPSENDWGITYDGTNSWISDVELKTKY